MSIQLQEVDTLGIAAEAPAFRVTRRAAAFLATAGRFGAVWLPAYAFLSSRAPSLTNAVLALGN